MHEESNDYLQPTFNDIRIDLRANNDQTDHRSHSLVPSRIPRYSGKTNNRNWIKISVCSKEYPQVRATNPLYTSRSTIKTQSISTPHSSTSRTSATLVNRRQKFDPQAPRRPSDWRWLAILCIILFFPLGLFAYAFARKAQLKFRDGFLFDAQKFNRRALILCILSILCGVTLIIGLLFGFDAWPRTNGW